MEPIKAAAHAFKRLCGGAVPDAFVVFGSGLGPVESELPGPRLPFGELPSYVAAGVPGHTGEFVATRLGGRLVLAALGRLHLYEGSPVDTVVLPVRAAATLGVPVMIATNAVGAVDAGLRQGEIVLVTDHINLTGVSPLAGSGLEELGQRFPGLTDAYRSDLRTLAADAAQCAGVPLRQGVLAAVTGPAYETPAEVRALRAIGADIVGMSTVVEVIAATHAGMGALVLSLVTNTAGAPSVSHEHVVEIAAARSAAVSSVVEGILSRL
jgi:purine-nucleoside phosphorylase